jgi:hypothetical protein
MTPQRLVDLVRMDVSAVRLDELLDFDLIVKAHGTNPGAAERARRPPDEATGSAIQTTG